MKNWKRFIAACLSVTMVASIPLTAFAESSVSVKELVPTTSNESETQEETDLEKILSQEKPYEYFSGLKDQEKLLDACKDEELFQLKEYMKYAYIHESDLKNRQSLDAYLLISKAWKNRNVTFDKDEQEKLLQLPEKAKVYGTKFEGKDEDGKSVEKTVKDFSIYMEYLQSIKKFDVPKYMELLSAFDEVKTEEDLANAKDAFSNFEEETFGFDEQEKKPVKEDSNAEEQPAKEDKKEDSNAEQSVKENPKEESKNADTNKKETESAKSATKIVEFVDVKENGYQPLQCHIISEKEKDTMSELLPKTVKAKMENGDIVDIDVKWNVDEDPKTTNSTVYTYDIQLPEKYSVSDQLQTLIGMEQSRLPFIYIKIKEELEKEGHQRPFLREPVYVEPESDDRAGTAANGHDFDYEIYDISCDGNKIVVKGWAYTPDVNQYGKYQGQAGNSVAATKDYVLNQHPEYQWGGYCLEVRNTSGGVVGSYPLISTERVDHTELWKGDSRNPTLIDVSFRFDIPLSDLVNKGDLYLNLHYIHPRVGDASFYLMYLAPSTSMTSGSYRVDFKADNISSFRTTGVQSYYNANPWKGGGAVTYNGNNLYYSTNDYFYLSNGTWVDGKRSLDSYKTTWFYTRTRYVGVTQSDGWMHRTKADPNGSFYGWIPSSFIQYGCSNFRLNVSYSSYKLTLNPNGGVSKGNTGAFTLSPDVIIGYGNWWNITGYTPTRTGYTFNGWYNAPSGGTKVYNADGTNVPNTAYWDGLKRWIYRGNLTVYAQWTPNIAHITYNVQGGTVGNGYGTNQYGHVSHNGSVWFHDVAYGSSSDPYDASTFGLTKTGYHFGGWRIRSSGTILDQSTSYGSTTYVDYSNSSLSTSNRSEVWCYLDAVWIPNRVQIAYHPNGGTVSASGYGYNPYGWVTQNGNTYFHYVDYGNDSDPYNATTFGLTKPGYRFAGWRMEPNGQILDQDTSYGSTTYCHYTNAGSNTSNMYNVTCYLYAHWVPDSYTNSISHWLYGFNNEGTNGDKHAFQIGSTSFSAINGNTFTLGANNAVTPPHGCYVENYIGTSSVTGNWTNYKFGQSFTQKPSSMGFQYNYSPYQYNINYNLDGGTNNSSNPSSYNVLYGLTLKAPTKTGYEFLGWEEDLFRAKDATIYNGASRNGETFTFTNSTSGNTFNASKVQVWTNDWSRYIAQPVYAGVGTHNNIVGTYTHTESTGNYMISVAANGSTQDYNAPLKNVYLEKGKTYTFTMGKSTVSSNQVSIGNIKITANATGINAGANASFSSATDLYNKLAARKIGDVKLTAKWKRLYALDVNAVLNGQDVASMDGSWFTFDVYINGSLYSNDVADFCTYFDAGTRYEVKDIKPKPGKKYLGTTYNTTLSGTIGNANTSVWLNFVSTHTNKIWHRMLGVKGADGESLLLGITPFDATFGTTYTMDAGKATKIPNGYKLYPQFRYNNNGVYENYDMGKTMTQEAKNMSYVYMYQAINYSITYNLNGGTNNAANPSTYNVLNGVSLKAPTKPGYKFTGWYQGDTKITGVNEGKNAIFSSVDEMYKELASRQTGDVTLTAKWTPIKYTISYEGNGATGGSTPSSNHTYDKPQTLTPNGFHKDGYYFDSWNTKPDGTGTSYQDKEEVKNLTSKDGDTVTLHAQWKPIDYKIIYKGNGSTSGTEKTHLYNQKDVEANGYAVKTNKGYTDFVRTKHTFMGWYQNSVVDTKAEMAKIYKQGSKLTYSQLLAIHAEQVKKGLVKDTDPKVKEIILYAVWDEAPGITIDQNAKDKFYEGVDVTRADLLSGITANDKIDGSLTSQIIITRIDYSAGKLVNGKKQAAYSQTWANGMPADAKLDTWFMQLDKNDSPVTHTITYQVKDSAGNITTAKKTIQVVYNEFPVIKANDFRFTLDDAQAGLVTKDKLLEKAVASGVVSASDVEDGDIKSKIELIDFDANAFKTMKQEGFIPITYRVQDSMGPGGKGKVTLKTVNVNIYLVRKEETVRYVRFINKKYYEKNANLDRNALAGKYDQIALLSVNGGLHPFSVWYTKADYRKLITETFDKTTGTTYVYTKEDIKKMREFVKQHGVGNAKEEDALSKFADIFMTGDYILK